MPRGKIREEHGMTGTRIHNIWRGMKIRCYDKNRKDFSHYGGRGIRMCSEWRKSFLAFYEWSCKNGYQNNLTIDRIDVNGDYEPANCRWVTVQQQENNRSNNKIIVFNGQAKTQAEWAKSIGLTPKALWDRLERYKWPLERALTQPKRRHAGGHYV